MGYGLAITVVKNTERIAVLYFYYDNFAADSITVAYRIMKWLDGHVGEDARRSLFNFVQQNGGGLFGKEYMSISQNIEEPFIRNLFPDIEIKPGGANKYKGLIAFTDKGMDTIENIADTRIIMYPDEYRAKSYEHSLPVIVGIHDSDKKDEHL